eukprot:3341623-Rhodomonas_salina.1
MLPGFMVKRLDCGQKLSVRHRVAHRLCILVSAAVPQQSVLQNCTGISCSTAAVSAMELYWCQLQYQQFVLVSVAVPR